ncbi:unnamed protein product [Lymnaea stagnalis]|uniref:RNA helicase n=1 Tax=Lymnaea stagnalis TaxID=6523 RepID=A0AAV2HLR6_LYMST
MAFITAELRLDEIENWFKIGQEAGLKHESDKPVASSSLGGHIFDPNTGGIYKRDSQQELDSRLPKYLRSGHAFQRQQYIDDYVLKENKELLSQTCASLETITNEFDALEVDSTIMGGSVAPPEDLIPEGATNVYRNYKLQHKYIDLPVLSVRDKIVSTIEAHQVTVIQGPTGSGKTTQVPQFIFDHYASESKYCNIVVTQPRKIAAVSIAQRVCDERGWSPGSLCGYQIALDRKCSEDTRILYCTTGILKEKLINKKNMHEFTHVILDEVHERDIESDFTLLIVKKLLRTNSSHVKVILMSATIDTDIFSRYFASPVLGRLENAPVVTIGHSCHKVSEFFADEISERLGELPPIEDDKPCIHPAMFDMAVELIKTFDIMEEKEQGKDLGTGFASVRGTVLMFLPGFYEITKMLDKLRPLEECHFFRTIPLHSSITLDEQNKAFMKPARGYRKVIVSTNIAESSITVPDIKYVIDFCLTKSLCCDPETNYPQLQMEWASKANAKQRKGRAGRVSNGRIYYMVPKWFFERVLPDYGTPEMQRSPLESLILKSKIFNMGEPKALLALALSPPNLDDIERTILSLKEVGALSSTVGENSNPHDGDMTFIGRVLAELPVDIRIGKLLVLGHVFGVLEECLIIGAAMSVKSIFANPIQSRLEAYKTKVSWSDNSHSDCIAMLNAYKVWENRVKMKEFQRSGATEKQWAAKNFLQTQSLKEVHKLIEELESRLLKFNIVRPRQPPSFKKPHTSAVERLILKLVLCGAFYPNFALKEETNEQEAVKMLSNNDPSRTVMVKGLPLNQGILYQNQIRDIFSSCQKEPAPVISCEQTRAFIEFPWKTGVVSEGRIHPGVYAAIKIRYLSIGIRMTLSLYDKEETSVRMKELQTVTSCQRSSDDLRTNRFCAMTFSGLRNDKPYRERIPLHLIRPETLSILCLELIVVQECGHFWAHCDDGKTGQLLAEVQMALNGSRTALKPLTEHVRPAMLVAAPYQDGSELYYRARVEEIKTEKIVVAGGIRKAVLIAVVFYVDYGNTEGVDISLLRALPESCLGQPFLAIEFYLRGIRPSSVRCADGVWSQQANSLFKIWTLNKILYAQIYSVVNNTVRVDLVAKNPNGIEICYNDELIQQEFAVPAEESFLSQQNHEWRENCKSGAKGSSNRPDSWVQVSLTANPDKPRQGNLRGKRVHLTGPYNPLEMSFCSMTYSGRQLVVKVDPESVNSVAIDDDPQNKSSRLMVASFIGLNPTGNTMIARETTILPQIPGLPALVTLVFAPYVEFRTNPKGDEYIGALCGLGYDEDSLPILPDHDVAIIFETVFENEDIAMINEVRMAINIALGTEDSIAGWGEDFIMRIQEKAREKLLALLKKKRSPVQHQSCAKPYSWNQIDPQLILCQEPTYAEADTTPLFRLHSAIALGSERDVSLGQKASRRDYYTNHVKELQRIATSGQRQAVFCELCKIKLPTSHILAIHLLTEKHLRNVNLVQEGKFK